MSEILIGGAQPTFGHGDATTRVFQQILGQGIQPTCG